MVSWFRPDAVVCQCGSDGLSGDPLGGFNLTPGSLVQCVKVCMFVCLLTAPYQAPHLVHKMLVLKDCGVHVPRGSVWLDSAVRLDASLRLGVAVSWEMKVVSIRCLAAFDSVPGLFSSPEVLRHQQMIFEDVPPYS